MQKKSFILFALFAVFAFVLLYISPYTRDDWAWGSSIGLERLSDFFKDYNGRYAGNIIEIILTRFRWLRALIETSTLCGLIYFMAPKEKNRIFFYAMSMCFILLEPITMMRQTLVYTAGFSNYVIPTLFMIGFIRYFEPLLYAGKSKDLSFKTSHSIPIGLAAFISCLFMEHITLYLLCLSAAVIFYSLLKYRKIFAVEAGFFMGNLLGSIMMFSNGAYWNVLNGSDTYRSLSNTASSSSADASYYMEETVYTLYAQNWFLNLILCVAVFMLLQKYKNQLKHQVVRISGNIAAAVLSVLTVLTGIVLIADKIGDYRYFTNIINNIPMIIMYIVLVSVCFICILMTVQGNTKKFLIFLSGSIIFINLPLLIVNPVSPRCFFPAFVLICVLIMESMILFNIPKWSTKVVISALFLYFIILFAIYIPLYKTDIERVNYIREQVLNGETEIVIENLPNEYFVWGITPEPGTKWERRYKLFYQIPEKTKLIKGDENE